MNTNPDTPIETLPAHECWALLRSVPIGRLAVVTDTGPEIFPLNHLVDRGSLLIRTGFGTKVSAAVGRPVAYEADGIDEQTGQVWSVVIKGHAELMTRSVDVVDALQAPLFPWHSGPKPHFLRLEPREISGRRFVISDRSRTSDAARDLRP